MSPDIFYLKLSLICALLAFMLDYGLGKPGREKFNIKSLLFSWSFYLAKRRLKIVGLYYEFENQKHEQKKQALTTADRLNIENNFRKIIFEQAKEYFVYEYAIGMCPICTHFWIALFSFPIVNIFYFSVNILTFILYLLLSHLFIRLFNKL